MFLAKRIVQSALHIFGKWRDVTQSEVTAKGVAPTGFGYIMRYNNQWWVTDTSSTTGYSAIATSRNSGGWFNIYGMTTFAGFLSASWQTAPDPIAEGDIMVCINTGGTFVVNHMYRLIAADNTDASNWQDLGLPPNLAIFYVENNGQYLQYNEDITPGVFLWQFVSPETPNRAGVIIDVDKVLNFNTSEPAIRVQKDRYYNTTTTASSSETGQALTANNVVIWNHIEWIEIFVNKSDQINDNQDSRLKRYNGTTLVREEVYIKQKKQVGYSASKTLYFSGQDGNNLDDERQEITLSGDLELTFSGMIDGGKIELILVNSSASDYKITWTDTTFEWQGEAVTFVKAGTICKITADSTDDTIAGVILTSTYADNINRSIDFTAHAIWSATAGYKTITSDRYMLPAIVVEVDNKAVTQFRIENAEDNSLLVDRIDLDANGTYYFIPDQQVFKDECDIECFANNWNGATVTVTPIVRKFR